MVGGALTPSTLTVMLVPAGIPVEVNGNSMMRLLTLHVPVVKLELLRRYAHGKVVTPPGTSPLEKWLSQVLKKPIRKKLLPEAMGLMVVKEMRRLLLGCSVHSEKVQGQLARRPVRYVTLVLKVFGRLTRPSMMFW